MASIFTYDPNPPRVSSPWSTPGSLTPTTAGIEEHQRSGSRSNLSQPYSTPVLLQDTGITRLEAEPQEGSTEYKLHLLLRPRRNFTSSTTGMDIYGSGHSRLHVGVDAAPEKDLQVPKSGYAPSNLTRQMRLQQLTTQLLWRLQQSSPFHSSSPGDLVLPKLPEASPKLGLPAKRAALLPGLEESQGALYEIGVSDDGALVGLIEEELEESLINLKAMASTLGCAVELLRKVAVGKCEWNHSDSPATKVSTRHSTLWVAEALVRPDVEAEEMSNNNYESQAGLNGIGPALAPELEIEAPRSQAEQLRVTLIGSTIAGKSSLLGTLSTSTLDNGRGKSRLSLLRHRHEITSGVTSSVAQELIGYHAVPEEDRGDTSMTAVNYATSDVSSWIDIHYLARRLVFISDSPGQPRYAKSTFRTLVSWQPHWTVVCISADEDEAANNNVSAANATIENAQDLHSSLTYVALCLKLELPIVIAITKMDLATKNGLRLTLGKILTALKEAGRKPVILSNTPVPLGEAGPDLQTVHWAERSEVDKMLASSAFSAETVPIVLTSAVTGLGIGKLHALMSSLPLLSRQTVPDMAQLSLSPIVRPAAALFYTDEVFMIPPSKVYGAYGADKSMDHGIVLCGHLTKGSISVGDSLVLGPFGNEANLGGNRESSQMRRTSSYSTSLSRSHPGGSPMLGTRQSGDFKHSASVFAHVRIVSIRNLRLPVRTLLEGQVGTVGVQLTHPEQRSNLLRARKGMVLMNATPDRTGYRSITATFPAASFATSTSPTLILGGHATVYVNAVRAAVKVAALDFTSVTSKQDTSSVFDFEDEHASNETPYQDVRISFRFVSTVEWMCVGDRVLVVPTASATGPIAGQVHTGTNTGLSGFVGTVSETMV
jgi:GTPase